MTTPVRSPYRPLDPGDPRRFTAPRELDVLVPTCNRPAELAATLAGLAGQEEEFGVVVSDQSDVVPGWQDPAPGGLVRVLRYRGHPVLLRHHLPRRGMAEQRAFLLRHSVARYVLFLDDDVWLEPGTIGRMLTAIQELGCGFVGNAPHGLSYVDDHRPEQQQGYEEWRDRPHPEQIRPRGPQWSRASVHSAANLVHLTQRLGLGPGEWRAYKVAWIGACVLFDRAKLVSTGGFDFWSQVPPQHEGEDVTAQLRVISRYGGAGVLPSGAYHLESPTMVHDRRVECFDLVSVNVEGVWRPRDRVGTRAPAPADHVGLTATLNREGEMARFGYTLMTEQSPPKQLVSTAAEAERAGFDFAVISDHYNPWLPSQGHSPYAWSVLGAVAQVTERIELMSYVTCPIRRYHPAVVAQKAATVALLADGRFTLGLGSGENLNEHVVGEWPHVEVRHDMFAEALEIIRSLLAGERLSFHGDFFSVPEARLWDRPADGVPMAVAASGPQSCELAAEYGDALIATHPDAQLLVHYDEFGGAGRPRIGQVPICYGPDEAACRRIVHDQWRWGGFGWRVLAELPEPASFEEASVDVSEDMVAKRVSCGPDVQRHVDSVRAFLDAGFTDVALVQVGADGQSGFLEWAARELIPRLREL